jgi:tRNA nucleotidyltransferase/poly(A) polymerase
VIGESADPEVSARALSVLRGVLGGERAWLVGGAVRDRLLHRPTADLDVAVAGDVAAAARRVAEAAGGAAFPLADALGIWRVVGPERDWHADLAELAGPDIDTDLARRDVTVNALAEPLAGGATLDPLGGRADLAAGRLRMVRPEAFVDDPLRCLRVARLACELDFTVEPATLRAARAGAPGLQDVAGERVFAELKRLLAAPRALGGLELMDRLGVTPVVLPELHALRGVGQSRYHHLDVHDHTLAVLRSTIELVRDPAPVFGADADALRAVLDEPLADELTRGQALGWGALLHDAAKPGTRRELGDGRIGFPGHDRVGAQLARDVLARLRASERLRAHVAALTRHHLDLGFLVHQRPLSRRAVYGYLRDCDPVAVDVTVLSVADRLATRGRKARDAIAKHLDLARELLGAALRRRAAEPEPPLIRGDELAAALRIAPGPRLGELLAELDAARFAGEVCDREQAIAHARAHLAVAGARER